MNIHNQTLLLAAKATNMHIVLEEGMYIGFSLVIAV
jgi:hypothetical protein